MHEIPVRFLYLKSSQPTEAFRAITPQAKSATYKGWLNGWTRSHVHRTIHMCLALLRSISSETSFVAQASPTPANKYILRERVRINAPSTLLDVHNARHGREVTEILVALPSDSNYWIHNCKLLRSRFLSALPERNGFYGKYSDGKVSFGSCLVSISCFSLSFVPTFFMLVGDTWRNQEPQRLPCGEVG